MATTLLGEKRSGSAMVRVSNGRLVYEEDWEYLVESDTRFEDRNVVLGTPGLPVPLVTTRGSMLCQTLSEDRREAQPRLWDVKASFSSEVQEGTGASPSDPSQPNDPALWIPVRETKYEEFSEIAYEDKNGDVIRNTAGVPFEVLPMFKRLIPVWEFWQFEFLQDVTINGVEYEGVTDEVLAERNETYNQAVYKGKQPFTLLCNVGHSSVGFYYGYRRRLTQYFLKYNKKNWKHRIPSQGYEELVGGVLTKIFVGGVPQMSYLDVNGAKVDDAADAYILWFDEYEPSDFAFLRI